MTLPVGRPSDSLVLAGSAIPLSGRMPPHTAPPALITLWWGIALPAVVVIRAVGAGGGYSLESAGAFDSSESGKRRWPWNYDPRWIRQGNLAGACERVT